MGISQKTVLFRHWLLTVAALCGWAICSAQAATGPFTQDQADSGHDNYMTSCASCHGDNLAGKLAPGLNGAAFGAAWAQHTTKELYDFVQTTMPACDGGSLSTKVYLNIVAFVLRENGAQPGPDALTPQTDLNISDIVKVAGAAAAQK